MFGQIAVAFCVFIDVGLTTILSKNKFNFALPFQNTDFFPVFFRFRMIFQFKTMVDILSLIWSFGAVFKVAAFFSAFVLKTNQ